MYEHFQPKTVEEVRASDERLAKMYADSPALRRDASTMIDHEFEEAADTSRAATAKYVEAKLPRTPGVALAYRNRAPDQCARCLSYSGSHADGCPLKVGL